MLAERVGKPRIHQSPEEKPRTHSAVLHGEVHELRWPDGSRGRSDRQHAQCAESLAGPDFQCNPLVVLNPRLPLTGQSELANLEAR